MGPLRLTSKTYYTTVQTRPSHLIGKRHSSTGADLCQHQGLYTSRGGTCPGVGGEAAILSLKPSFGQYLLHNRRITKYPSLNNSLTKMQLKRGWIIVSKCSRCIQIAVEKCIPQAVYQLKAGEDLPVAVISVGGGNQVIK